jgi:hypothetical protein
MTVSCTLGSHAGIGRCFIDIEPFPDSCVNRLNKVVQDCRWRLDITPRIATTMCNREIYRASIVHTMTTKEPEYFDMRAK